MTFADLTRIANETIQLPALYGCKNDTRMCRWPPWKENSSIPTDHYIQDDNGYNWVVLSTDGKYPALPFVYNMEDRSIIYCSSYDNGKGIKYCDTEDIDTIHYLTRVEKSGKPHKNLSS